MNWDTIKNALGQLGTFFKVINKNDWAEDATMAGFVLDAAQKVWDSTGGHFTLETLRQAAFLTALGVLAKAAISLLTALHVLVPAPVAADPSSVTTPQK